MRIKPTNNSKLLLIYLFILFFPRVYSQTEVWVTIDNDQILTSIIKDENILSLKKALPDSRKKSLQNVYEVTCSDLISFLRLVKRNKDISNPEVIEDFELLYDPNDFNLNFSNDYALELINAKGAWDISQGAPYMKIGVFEQGYDLDHEELSGKYTYVFPNNDISNSVHGTAVAITAAGKTDNDLGKSSIGFKSSLSLHGMSYNELLAATYAGVQVISISWASGCNYNQYYQGIIEEVHQNGSVIIAAAGNGPTCGGADQLVYPAAFEHVIAVSSIDQNDKHQPIINDPTSTHQHNDSVDLVAPGYNVALSLPNNQYVYGNGSSFAAPLVAGTAALMLSVNNCLTPDQIEQILKESSRDIYAENPLFLGKLGAGRLDAALAVQMAKESNPIDYNIFKFNSTCNEVEAVFVTLNTGDTSNHTIQWSDGSNDWSRYNLISDNYDIMISNSDGCVVHDTINYSLSGPAFDYTNSVLINGQTDQLDDLNGDGLIKVKGCVVVENGFELSITDKTLMFSSNNDLSGDPDMPSSGIVVKPNAKLLVKRSIIRPENSCITTFGGIEILTNGLNQAASLQLIDSRIENAQVAVTNVSKTKIGSDYSGGGEIIIDNTSFLNNFKAIHIVGSDRSRTIPVISNSIFEVNEMIPNVEQIYIENEEIKFEFNDLIGFEGLITNMRGTGMVLKNSRLTPLHSKPLLDQYLNTFKHFTNGLVLDSCNSSEETLEAYLFDSNQIGLLIDNSKNVILKNSEFILANGTYQFKSIGLKQTGASQSRVVNNLFKGYGASAFNTGIKLLKQDLEDAVIIHSNEISGDLMNGVLFVGKNKVGSFSCNNFAVVGINDFSILDAPGESADIQFNNTTFLNDFSDNGSIQMNINNASINYTLEYADVQDYLPNYTSGNVDINPLNVTVDRNKECSSITTSLLDNSSYQNIDDVLSLDENQSSSYVLHPNPNDGNFVIGQNENIEEVYIYSMKGDLIKKYGSNHVMSTYELNVTKGVYNVVVKLKNGDTLNKKMVVNSAK